MPIAQANLRREGRSKDPKRAKQRAAQLAAPGLELPLATDWQRHYRVLAHLAADEPDGLLPDIAPGVLFEGDDLGKWLQRQRRSWTELSQEQQQRLSKLGVQRDQAPPPAPEAAGAARGPSKAQTAFQRGLAALTQWVEREGAHRPVPRGHSEEITVDDQEEPVTVKLGVWVSNTKSRRAGWTPTSSGDALRQLGMEWA
ncbi:Helicase associated domain protein [Streptomyces sp. enrichment culture]|uniref:Helicase associated domain protein n=1 Tax=Streptomyces sp. enrichment culture TaxID=1795815 RepID=UPI003F5488EB